jgi:hypothetical protein
VALGAASATAAPQANPCNQARAVTP